jgi:hypothetical protein
MTPPIHAYATHAGGTCAVTGGYAYRGAAFPDLSGLYIYGDYCNGMIWSLSDQGGGWANQDLLDTSLDISSFGEDESGELYLTDASGGAVYRIVQVVVTNPIYLPVILSD